MPILIKNESFNNIFLWKFILLKIIIFFASSNLKNEEL